MKVFGDYGSGSSGTQLCTDDMVVSALNDAEKLGADVINLSLGSDLDEFYDAASYKVFERLQKKVFKLALLLVMKAKELGELVAFINTIQLL